MAAQSHNRRPGIGIIAIDLVSMTGSRVESMMGVCTIRFARAIWVLVPKLPIYNQLLLVVLLAALRAPALLPGYDSSF